MDPEGGPPIGPQNRPPHFNRIVETEMQERANTKRCLRYKAHEAEQGSVSKGSSPKTWTLFFMGAECPNRLADDSGDDSVYVTYMFNVIKK